MSLQKDYDTLLRAQRLYGTGPEQLKKSIDANYEKAEKIERLERALKDLFLIDGTETQSFRDAVRTRVRKLISLPNGDFK